MPEREATWLLRDKYGGKVTVTARKDIEQLRRGEPLDYVIGWANFLGLKVDLSARPLIPRPETEYWTEKVIAGMPDKPLRVLDVFCGSGCIGLAVLKNKPHALVDFSDINRAYFPGIRRSARWNKIAVRRFRIFYSNVLENIGINKKYDYILANPPYVPLSGRRIQKSVMDYEPHNALFAGKDGLKFIRALMRKAKTHLAPNGMLIVEFDPPQKRAIGALARRLRYDIQFFKDQYDRWRYIAMRQKVQG